MEEKQIQKNKTFVREKIKNKPMNKRRTLIRLLISALSGIVFAGTACIVFALVLPHLNPYMAQVPDTETQTGASEETEQATETQTEIGGQSTQDEQTETQMEDDSGERDGADDLENQKDELQSLTIAAYQELQDQLYRIGAEANAAVVSITSVVKDIDLFHNSYEEEDQSCGVVIGENEEEYFILTERKVIKDASRISVSFLNNTACEASLKKEDCNTGLAILSVEKSALGDNADISIATIGNSKMVRNGMIVIALGSPLGTNYSILTGNITSTNNEVSLEDRNYNVFTTDIIADREGSGILVNVNGEVIGIVMQDYSASRAENTLTAIAATELQAVIDKLCAGEDIPYLGMKVSTVTDKIEDAYGIPKGVYVKSVAMDSPAMKAGIQSGDVIVSINGADVRTDIAYTNELFSMTSEQQTKIVIKRKGANEYATISYDVTVGVRQ